MTLAWRSMRRAVILAIPFVIAIPIAYGVAFVLANFSPDIGPLLAGAAGWLAVQVLRIPIVLSASRISRNEELVHAVVTASSGFLEEPVRLAALLLTGANLGSALWLGLGWATAEVLYTIANGLALAALATRTDPEAQRLRATLPPAAVSPASPAWGVVERAWASAIHIGFTLILAAAPIAVLATAPAHALINLGLGRAMGQLPMAAVSGVGFLLGVAILAVGLALN